ncbi:unnamed protein product [Musa textilis]
MFLLKAIPLSDDHKPNRSLYCKHFEFARTWKVRVVLAMSRAFGNCLLEQCVVAEPEIREEEVDEHLELLVLASNGLWDVVAHEVSSSTHCNICSSCSGGRTRSCCSVVDIDITSQVVSSMQIPLSASGS